MERDNFISSIILSLVGLFVVKKYIVKGGRKVILIALRVLIAMNRALYVKR